MATVYIPDEMIDEVKLMKRYRRQGRKYYITLDFKEESRNEEKLPPCTPFSKEEKKKEERALSLSLARKEILPIPCLDEITEYATKFENLTFTPEYFFHHYNALGWKVRGEMIENWQSLFESWVNDPKKKGQPGGAKGQRSEQRQQALQTAETRMQEEAERQTAEREKRLKRQAEESVSWAEYLRMKQEGKV